MSDTRHTAEPAADYEDWLAAHQMVKRLQAELAALRAERDELRVALKRIHDDPYTTCNCGDIARAALARAERKA